MTYTMRLSDVIRMRGGKTHIDDNNVRVLDRPEILHLDKYPLHDPAHRTTLNGLILDTYWDREIAHDNVETFKHQLRTQLNTIMPLYNQLYASAAIKFDPLVTTDMLSTSKQDSETVSERESSAQTASDQEGMQQTVSSDTPQVMLKGDGHYATNGVTGKNDSTATGSASDESTATDVNSSEAESRTVGYNGSPAALIQAYRETILNIDQMIVTELESLFLILWGSPFPIFPSSNYRW